MLINIADEKIYKEWQIDLNDLKNKTTLKIIPKYLDLTSSSLDDGSVVITEARDQ